MIQRSLILAVILSVGVLLSLTFPSKVIHQDFKRFYDQFQVEGTFVLYDQNQHQYHYFNQHLVHQKFTPASTFKICNSLIGLETGVIKDEHFRLAWDSVVRQNPKWNTDTDLKSAFQNSTVWYYQELARRVGGKQMYDWLKKVKYGNADTSGGIDRFWLTGGLRISPMQQIDFLKKLQRNKLPFSKRSAAIVKDIMIVKDTLGYTLRAKTGWGFQDNQDIGWYVGYLEKGNNVYYFANCIQEDDANNPQFGNARIEIVELILKALRIID